MESAPLSREASLRPKSIRPKSNDALRPDRHDTSGGRCPGPGSSHVNARGLRLYYGAAKTASNVGLQIAPSALDEFFFDSDGGICADIPSPKAKTFSLDETAPGATVAKCRDSGAINFANGNPWQLIGTGSLPLQ